MVQRELTATEREIIKILKEKNLTVAEAIKALDNCKSFLLTNLKLAFNSEDKILDGVKNISAIREE